MTKHKVIALTGISGYWGTSLAKKLSEIPNIKLIGIDDKKPLVEIENLDFIQADIRNPLLADLLTNEKVDTLYHLAFKESKFPNESDFDHNVMGTLKLFGAAVEAGVRKIIVKSSTQVYGAKPNNPGYIPEEHQLRGSQRYGYTRDLVEIEIFCNGFRRQHPQILITTLRFPNIIGPKSDTPMNRLLSNPYAPILLGFDPVMQFIHEDDVTAALIRAYVNDTPGIFNIAAEDVISLNRALRLTGRLPIQIIHTFAYWGSGSLAGSSEKYFPLEPDYLRYRWVADITKMKKVLEFSPLYTAEEALREMAGELRIRKFMPRYNDLEYDEERLKDTLERRTRSYSNENPSTEHKPVGE